MIDKEVKDFLINNDKGDMEYSIIKDPDSSTYIVQVYDEDLPIDDLFDVAEELCLKALDNESRYIVIAGVK